MPDWSTYVRSRLQLTALREERQVEIIEDLARQLDDAYREALAAGAPEAEARRRAEQHIADWPALSRQLSASTRERQPPVVQWQNATDDRDLQKRGRFTFFGRLRQDVLYGIRMLRATPGVTSMAALSLALGIGANTAIFSVMHALVFRPLPIPYPEQLVAISDPASAGMMSGIENGERAIFSYHEFEGMRDRNGVLDGLMSFSSEILTVPVSTGDVADSRPTGVTMTSGGYFTTLRVPAATGHTFGAEVESALLAHPVAVVSHAFWRDRLQSDPQVTSRTIRIRQTTFTVIGVMPSSFTGIVVGEAPDIWIPLTMQQAIAPGRDWLAQQPGTARRTMFLHVVGRLKAGITLAQADAGMNVAFKQTIDDEAQHIADPERRRDLLDAHVLVKDVHAGLSPLRASYRDPLGVLLALVGLLLLLACANVANLLLARAAGRQRELAVRVALGAARGRLLRQLLTESVMLAGLGALLGLGVGVLGIRVLLRLVSADNTPIPIDAGLDPLVLGFTAALTVITGVLFGIAPALRATRTDVNTVIRGTATNIAGTGHSRWSIGKILAGLQVAISLVLLVSAGLFVRTLQNLSSVDLKYDPRPILLFQVDPTVSGYSAESTAPFFENLLARLSTLPGVQHASLSDNGIFMDSESGLRVSFPGYTPPAGLEMDARFDRVAPGFFATVGIPIRTGRDVEPQDATGVPPCWLNETMTKYYFPDRSPVGQQMTLHYSSGDHGCEIRGVVADVRTRTLSAPMERRFYQPYFGNAVRPPSAVIALRTSGDPMDVTTGVRRIMREITPALEPPEFHTIPDLIERRLVQKRLTARLSAVFGTMALLLASIGLYGVLAYAVSRRTTEIGVRMALGSTRARILALVMQDALIMMIAGAVVGLAGAWGLSRLLESMLFGLKPRDPSTIAMAIVVLLAVATIAAAIPAWRASQTDPLKALRESAS